MSIWTDMPIEEVIETVNKMFPLNPKIFFPEWELKAVEEFKGVISLKHSDKVSKKTVYSRIDLFLPPSLAQRFG